MKYLDARPGPPSVPAPGTSTDNALVRWNGVLGDSLQDGAATEDDLGNVTGINDLGVAGDITVAGTVDGVAVAAHAASADAHHAEAHAHTHASTTGQTADDHHAEAHDVDSHDTTATGAELDELTDGSTTSLHAHAAPSIAHADTTGKTTDDHHAQVHLLASHSDLTATGPQVDGHLAAAAPHAGHAASVHAHAATDITSGVLADARVQQSNVTQHVPYTRGTSFPGSPVDGEVCYRTDLQYEFQYFGTRAKWLGTTEYMVNFGRNGTNGVGYLRLINGMVCSATVGHYLPWAVTITGWSYAQATLVAGYYRAYLGGAYQVGAQINHASTTNSNDVQSVDIAQGVLAVYNSSGTVSNPQVFIRYRRTG